jgi:subtilase family serine protease
VGITRCVRSVSAIAVAVVVVLLATVAGSPSAPVKAAWAGAAVPADAPPGAGFTRTGDAPDGAVLHLALGLARDTAAIRQLVLDVSDPASPSYGEHLTVGQFADRFGSPAAPAVVEALEAEGIPASTDPTGLFVHARPTVAQASTVFSTTFGRYDGTVLFADQPFYGADTTPTLPDALDGLVSELTGFTQALPITEPPTSADVGTRALPPPPTNTGTPSGCADAVASGAYTISQLLTAYGIGPLGDGSARGAGGRVAELIDGDGYVQGTVDEYTTCLGLPARVPTFHLVPPQDAPIQYSLGETNGDIQTIVGVSPALERLDLFQGVTSVNQLPLLFAAALDPSLTGGIAPDAVTFSSGQCEDTVPLAVVQLLEDVLATFGAVGTTVAVAAGDNGSATCPDEPGTSLSYPASSPWVVAVGGTNLILDADNAIVDELVWNDNRYSDNGGGGATGGGPSAFFERPAWQTGPGTGGPARQIPDVVFMASFFPGTAQVLDLGGSPPTYLWGGAAGTSFSTPLFASAIAGIDAQRRAMGLPNLGLVTPLLYARADALRSSGALRDITEGSNDVNGVGCCTATPFFDMASGLGSVRVDLLAAALTPAPVLELRFTG